MVDNVAATNWIMTKGEGGRRASSMSSKIMENNSIHDKDGLLFGGKGHNRDGS